MKEPKLPTPSSLGPHSGGLTIHPLSQLLLDKNKKHFRQSVLSICSLHFCINGIFDVMTWSSPACTLSVFCANLWRTVMILIMSQQARLISEPMRQISWKRQGTGWGALKSEKQRDSLLFVCVYKTILNSVSHLFSPIRPVHKVLFEPHMI